MSKTILKCSTEGCPGREFYALWMICERRTYSHDGDCDDYEEVDDTRSPDNPEALGREKRITAYQCVTCNEMATSSWNDEAPYPSINRSSVEGLLFSLSTLADNTEMDAAGTADELRQIVEVWQERYGLCAQLGKEKA